MEFNRENVIVSYVISKIHNDCRGGSRIFREGGLNIEVSSEAGGLGGCAPQKLWVFLVI